MKRFKKFEPGEDDLPEGWEPEDDQNPRWLAMVDLMKQADDPRMPPPAMFEAVRIQTRRQALEEGLLDLPSRPEDAEKELGFRQWLRLLFSGGGGGAQVLRLSVVGSLAFVFAVQFIGTSAPMEGLSMATAPGKQVVMSADNEELAEVSGDDQYAASSSSVPRSIHDVGNSRGWMYRSPSRSASGSRMGAVPVSAASVSPDTQQNLVSQALNSVQVLKFNSMVEQNDQDMADLRQLDHILTQIVMQSQASSTPEAAAIQQLRLADQYTAERRYLEAQEILERVTRIMPGSSLALLAQFQIGALAYERTHDYDLALESFRRCLSDYPESMISGRYRTYLQERVRVIEETSNEQWKTLKMWQQSLETPRLEEKTSLLLLIVRDSESPMLAAEAGMNLKDLLIADSMQKRLDDEKILGIMRGRLQQETPTADAARLQFAIAEVVAHRIQNPALASQEYRQVLALHPDEQTAEQVRTRMRGMVSPLSE